MGNTATKWQPVLWEDWIAPNFMNGLSMNDTWWMQANNTFVNGTTGWNQMVVD